MQNQKVKLLGKSSDEWKRSAKNVFKIGYFVISLVENLAFNWDLCFWMYEKCRHAHLINN